jgi:hypothetical protein
LDKVENNPKYLWTFPPLFFLWSNIHGAFAFGLFTLTVFTLEKLIRKEKSAFLSLKILLLSLFATLINPYGLGIYSEGLKHITYPLGGLIAEWVSPDFTHKIIIFSLLIFILISLISKSFSKKIFWFTMISFFSIFAFSARRNLPFFALAFSECLLYIYNDNLSVLENSRKFKEFSIVALIISFVAYIWLNILPANYITSINSTAYCNNVIEVYPCKAVIFLNEKGVINQNIFANYEWGGYLEWALPKNKYFVDGRMPTWKNPENLSPYTVHLNIIQAKPGYESMLDQYKTDVILIGAGSYLDLDLSKNNPIWKQIYRDGVSVVFVRRK